MMKNITYFASGTHAPVILNPVHEGIHFEFDGNFSLIWVVNRPTSEEKRAFKNGPYQFGLAVVDDVIFFLSRFGTLNWMDAPFNIHLYHDDRVQLLEDPNPTQGYGLHIILIDSRTGTLVHQRLISLDHDLSMRLHDAIIHQPVIPNYNKQLQDIMVRYSTRELVALGSSYLGNKGKNSTVTGVPQLRPSHRGLTGIQKDDYPLPEDLREFNYYYNDDNGHVVMAIPESLLPQAIKSGNLDNFEAPIPCRYILAKGYRFFDGHVICDAPYNKRFGVDIHESWYDQ